MGMLQLHSYEKSASLLNDARTDWTHHEQDPKLLMNQAARTRKTFTHHA